MNSKICPVILSGGAGTRLWPLSRKGLPKQFLQLGDEHSLLQRTAQRVSDESVFAAPILVAGHDQRFLVAEQLAHVNISPHTILLEPLARNTAPAVAVAAQRLIEEGRGDTLMLVLPSDHAIAPEDVFLKTITSAVELAKEGKLCTFGVQPTRPETGYGYIQRGEKIGSGYTIRQFVEKPDAPTAKAYLEDKQHYWNAGIFLFQARTYIQELKEYAPLIAAAAARAVEKSSQDLGIFTRVDATEFAKAPDISIDYAVMEKTTHGVVIPLECQWTDIGSFEALWGYLPKDAAHNATYGDVITHDADNNLIYATHGLVAALGISNHVIVQTKDATLVVPKHKTQDVKKIAQQLKETARIEADFHTKVYRPWGSYEGLGQDAGFQVKRIVVKPGERLSLQMHHHRSEHWVVVKGTLQVTCGEKVFDLGVNESTYIPKLTKHRLENLTDESAEMIEVQVGDYLGEDDIVRFDDSYGRTGTVG